MSLFQRLGARALGALERVEPIVEPSPLGPVGIEKIGPAAGFDELVVEQPVRAPSVGPAGPRPSSPAPLASSPSSPRRPIGSELAGASQAPALVHERVLEVPIERAPERARSAPIPSERPPTIPAPKTVVEHHHEHTRELIHERPTPTRSSRERVSSEPAPAPLRVRADAASPEGRRPRASQRAKPAQPLVQVAARESAPAPRTPRVEARSPAAEPLPSRVDAPLASLEQPPAPVVQVSIGRVIVRADAPARSSTPRASQSTARPSVSLADYLAQRDRGER